MAEASSETSQRETQKALQKAFKKLQQSPEKNSLTKKLGATLKQNVMATVSLTGAMVTAMKSQETLAKTFISTGQQQALSAANLNKTFGNVGLNLAQSVEMFGELTKLGISTGSEDIKKSLASTAMLGKNMSAFAKNIGFNTQVLGMSEGASVGLSNSLHSMGAAYHIDSNVLVDAINQLTKTLIESAATYGAESAAALQTTIAKLTAQYGGANKDLVTEMTSALFAGNEKSTKMAVMLNLDINRLATTDSGEQMALVQEALKSLKDKVGGAAGSGESGFTVPKLLAAFGATPGMLVLANQGPQTEEALALQAEDLANEVLANSLMMSLESIMKDLTVMILPIIEILAMVIKPFAFALTMWGGLLKNIMVAIVASRILMIGASAAHSVKLWIAEMRTSDAVRMGNTTLARILATNIKNGAKSAMGAMGGPWGLALTAAITIGTTVASHYGSKADENQKDILSEQEKQTAALYDNQESKILGQISSRMLQANMYNQQLVLNAQEQLEVAIETKESKVEIVSTPDPGFTNFSTTKES